MEDKMNIEKMVKAMGEMSIPEEFIGEVPDEEILYNWDGGVINEVK